MMGELYLFAPHCLALDVLVLIGYSPGACPTHVEGSLFIGPQGILHNVRNVLVIEALQLINYGRLSY